MIDRKRILAHIEELRLAAANARDIAEDKAKQYVADAGLTGDTAEIVRLSIQNSWLESEMRDLARRLGYVIEDLQPKRASRARKAS